MLLQQKNRVYDNGSDDFYVSYNAFDHYTYGCDTTALVWGQMQYFFILSGDHRKQYEPLLKLGFDACYEYYKQNKSQHNKCTSRDRTAMELELKIAHPVECKNWRSTRFVSCVI